ncbi:MAG TPA: YIP1 family protein [Candidatus Acidoferrales bacterium]|jgi:hypothetical protein|nr:YIP1 family protein [Candidatus Acidoferrales bacterium]
MFNSSVRPGPVWFAGWLLYEGLTRLLWPYQTIFLVVTSESRWNGIVQSERTCGRTAGIFFVPMLLTLAGLEGLGLKKWVRWHDVAGLARPLTDNEAAGFEAVRCLMIVLAMLACAQLLKVFSGTFRNRNTHAQALTLVIYSFAPICLMRSLLVFYPFNDWVLWGIGVVLALKVLYHGLPRILEPDPPQALGLFFLGAFSLCLVTLLERFITLCYLCKACRPPALT